MSIKNQAILVVVAIILFLSSFFLYIGQNQIANNLKWKIKNEQENLSIITNCIMQKIYFSYKARLKLFIDENSSMVEALSRQNIQILDKKAKATLAKLRHENRYIAALNFYTVDGKFLLSASKSPKESVKKESKIVKKAISNKRQISGFITGCSGIFYRIIHPVSHNLPDNKGYAGAVELKINVRHLFDLLENKFHANAVLYFKDFACSNFHSNIIKDFKLRHMGEYTLVDYGHAVLSDIPDDLNLTLENQERTIGNKSYSIYRLADLKDINGKIQGTVMAFHDITEENRKKFNFLITSVLSIFAVLILAFAVLYISFNKLVGSLEQYRGKLEDTVKELEDTRATLEEQVEQRTFEISVANASLNREIAERIQAEGSVRHLQHRLELILNSAGEGIFGIDAKGKVTFVNNAAVKILGWRSEDLLGKSHHEIVHHHRSNGAEYPEDECPIYLSYKDGLVHKGNDEVFWKKDNTPLAVEYVSTPIVEKDKLVGAVVIFRDITKQLRDDEERARLQRRFKLILDSAGNGIFGLDQKGKVTFVNEAALLMLGFTEDEILNKSHHKLVHHTHGDGSEFPENECPIYMACRDGQVHFSSEDIFWRKDGSHFEVEYISTPIKEEDKLVGAVVVFRDQGLRNECLPQGD